MFAQVIDGSVVSHPKGNKGIIIDDVQYPSTIYTLWTEAERNAIGIYTVEIDNTNFKDETYYINTNQTIAYDSSADKVTASYGTATAKRLNDENKLVIDEIVKKTSARIFYFSSGLVYKLSLIHI